METLAIMLIALWVGTALPRLVLEAGPRPDWGSPTLYLTLAREVVGLILAICVLVVL